MACRPESGLRLIAALALVLAAPALVGAREDAAAALDRARAALNAGKLGVARAEAQHAVQDDPGSVAAHVLHARVQLALGDGVGAEAALQRAFETGAAPDDLRHLRAHAALLRGEPLRTLDLADPAHGPQAHAAYAARMRGRAHAVLGDLAEAKAAFAQAIALTPRDAVAWADLARFHMMADDLPGAIDASDRAVAYAPTSPEILMLKGELVRTQYGLVAALPWFERALAIDPGNMPALVEAAATLGEVGRMREMLAMTRRILEADPRNPAAFYLQAVLAARAGRYDLARRLLLRTGDMLADLPGAQLLGAVLDVETGNQEQAIAALQKLRVAQPHNRRIAELLGIAMWRAGDSAGAVAVLAPLAESGDAGSYALGAIGRAYEAVGDRVGASYYLDRAASAVTPPARAAAAVDLAGARRAASIDFSEANAFQLIAACDRAGQPAAADAVLRLFLTQNPRNPAALRLAAERFVAAGDWRAPIGILEGLQQRLGGRDAHVEALLARARLESGNAPRALAAARQAYALAPFSAETTSTYGWTLLQVSHDVRRAIELFEKAAALDPGDPLIQARLRQARAIGVRRH